MNEPFTQEQIDNLDRLGDEHKIKCGYINLKRQLRKYDAKYRKQQTACIEALHALHLSEQHFKEGE